MRRMERPIGVRKGAWTWEEDDLLRKCIEEYGEGKWHQVPSRAGLNRCRKSCRLRWLNYLKPNINRGKFAEDEVDLILRLHKLLGNRWSLIAGRLPGRTANDVKNYWNSHLRKISDNSFNKNVIEKAQETENIDIIKPRPRKFSKSSPWLRRKTTNPHNPQFGDDNLCKPSTQFDHRQWNETETETAWWESLLFINEFEEGTSSSVLRSDAETTANLYVEKSQPEMNLEGNFNDQEWQSSTLDDEFSFDVKIWSLLNANQKGLI